MKPKRGFVLAGMEDIVYQQESVTLTAGDTLFLYTDGVTEADNKEKELYSEKRLFNIANANVNASLKELCVNTRRDIEQFANGEEQADDITMLAVRFKGKEGKT
jgi:sigma-B regulation protein RsbU (phosphoserine phosphatase)